jgi:hypothetical protein
MAGTRTKITITLPDELVEWLHDKVTERTFANISHGVELCILEGKRRYGKPKGK